MKLDELFAIQLLKEQGYIKDENDIAEIKTDDGNIFIKLNKSLETVDITVEVNE